MDDFAHLNEEEKLKAENDFLKMKMMLENGAQFHEADEMEELPPGIENAFLKNILKFEEQFEQRKVVTVFDKIEKPQHFKPVNDIADNEMDNAWKELHAYMLAYGVGISAHSPKVTSRELYRFTTEELFQHEMDDINIPGMQSGFIYDEFYPDYEFENTTAATEDCIKPLLNKRHVDFIQHLQKNNLRLNNHTGLTGKSFMEIINRFKDAFDNIELHSVAADSCSIEETTCIVKGVYAATATFGNDALQWNNDWMVCFHFEDDQGYWCITDVELSGIDF